MNVGQLIDKLREYPQDMSVVIRGYEDGYDNPEVDEIDVLWNYNVGPEGEKVTWYYGSHAGRSHGPLNATRRVVALR